MCAAELEAAITKYCNARVAGQPNIQEVHIDGKDVKIVWQSSLTGVIKTYHTLNGTDIGTICYDFLSNHFAPGFKEEMF